MNTSSERPPLSIPGVANRTHGPGASIFERSNGITVPIKTTCKKTKNVFHDTQYNKNLVMYLSLYRIIGRMSPDLVFCTMFEIESVPCNIGVFDFLIGPADQQLIIHICLHG